MYLFCPYNLFRTSKTAPQKLVVRVRVGCLSIPSSPVYIGLKTDLGLKHFFFLFLSFFFSCQVPVCYACFARLCQARGSVPRLGFEARNGLLFFFLLARTPKQRTSQKCPTPRSLPVQKFIFSMLRPAPSLFLCSSSRD